MPGANVATRTRGAAGGDADSARCTFALGDPACASTSFVKLCMRRHRAKRSARSARRSDCQGAFRKISGGSLFSRGCRCKAQNPGPRLLGGWFVCNYGVRAHPCA